jgi:hypothetical protein
VEIIQEIFDIVYGARHFLPETKITIGICIGLALLIYFKRSLGGLVTSVLVTILIANSYFAESDIYEVSPEKAVLVGRIDPFIGGLYKVSPSYLKAVNEPLYMGDDCTIR